MRILSAFLLLTLAAPSAFAFPDNVRHGYASCSSCHVSPSGGGVLTEYGRKSSEDFLATWSREGENGAFWGAAELPPNIAVGADARYISYKRDLDSVKTERRIVMQVEGEVAIRFGERLWVDFSRGDYNKREQTQRAYALFNASENLYVRAGKFFAPFGIYEPDHTVITRRQLGFDQGAETFNMEAGLLSEAGEVSVTAITGDFHTGDESIDPVSDAGGYAMRAALYPGGNSQAGLSFLSTGSEVMDRAAAGAFVMTGLGDRAWYLGELDIEQKSFAPGTAGQSRAIVSHHKLGWEGLPALGEAGHVRGLNLFATWDSLVPIEGDSHSRQWSAGPGIQWFPRPHFEASIQVLRVYHESRSRKTGQDIKMMAHLWL